MGTLAEADLPGALSNLLVANDRARLWETEESLLRVVLENVPEIVSLLNLDGTIAYVNRTVQGLTREQVLGRPVTDFIPRELAGEVRGLLADVIASGRIREYECPGAGPNGTTATYWSRVSPVRSGEALSGLLLITRDITEQNKVEEQTARLQNELAHVSRLSTLGAMASGMAHELNQPLTAIVAYADACQDLIESGRMQNARLLEVLRSIATQAERAGKIIQQMRRLVKKSEPVRAAVSVNDAVRDVAGLLEPEARQAGVTVRLNLDTGAPQAWADLVQIQQVLLNLIRNGIEAMSGCERESRELTIATCRPPGDTVEITVEDRGPAVNDETARRMFDPFFTTKPEGLGMGLSISRGIVELHGGRLWATPNSDQGLTVHCVLPAPEPKGDP